MNDVDLEHRLTLIEAGQGEIKGGLQGVQLQLGRLADNVAVQNGRVGKLEDGAVVAKAFADGAASITVSISKRDKVALGGLVSAVILIVGAIADYLATR